MEGMQPGFFDQEDRLAKLDDSLSRLDNVVDLEAFQPLLKVIRQKQRKGNTVRKPHDATLMFKMQVLQVLYNLSHDQTEYREHLARHRLIDKLFRRFIDKEHRLIRRYAVTDANVHDSQAFDELLDEEDSGRSICLGLGRTQPGADAQSGGGLVLASGYRGVGASGDREMWPNSRQ